MELLLTWGVCSVGKDWVNPESAFLLTNQDPEAIKTLPSNFTLALQNTNLTMTKVRISKTNGSCNSYMAVILTSTC